MKLSDLLAYDTVTIQCHDNPDADAIASGYALYCYLQEHGKQAVFMYSGRDQIQKDNLRIMVEQLRIPITYVEPNHPGVTGLLVTVDCQYGARNVTRFASDEQMIIDHHKQEIDQVKNCHIASNFGSCSTVIWKMMVEEQFPFENYPDLQTALYYGLYMDTSQFIDISNPYDRDLRDAMEYNPILLHWLQNSNLSAKELEIASVAMLRTIINKEKRFAVVKSDPCDPNILGMISDFVMQVSELDSCVVFNVFDHGIKFSVRSCVKEIRADHMAATLAKTIGSGGGHAFKAGGYISSTEYNRLYRDLDHVTFFTEAMMKYLDSYDIIDTSKVTFDDLTTGKMYHKIDVVVGYVNLSDFLPIGAEVVLRTLEGDLTIQVAKGDQIMIGVKGEIYPITEEKFKKNYEPLSDPYRMELEYHPKAKVVQNGVEYCLLDYARCCRTIVDKTNEVLAAPLTKGVKLFTSWYKDSYMLGEVGDYLVAKADDRHDVYIVRKDIFELTYVESLSTGKEKANMSMEELIDIYGENREFTGLTVPRKTKLNPGQYMLYALALLQNREGKILITKRALDKKWAPGSWEIPGGGAHTKETTTDTVLREAFEETGIRVSPENVRVLYSYRNDDPKGDNYYNDIFLCTADFTLADVRVQEEEVIDVALATVEEIKSLHEKDGFLHYERIMTALSNI